MFHLRYYLISMCTKFSEKLIFPILTDMHMSVCVSAGKKRYDAPLGVT